MEPIQNLKSPTGDPQLVTANYNKLSDHIRRLTPQGIQCSVFCGGVHCKYENPENWTADSLAIQGLYSHWITDNILAMARPSTVIIIQKNIIQQFQSLGIKSIINLQCPKEHASCGQPLESSGFSYDPNIFMENNIYYYNFTWKDYGDATLIGLINMVKVVAFAVTEGRVAIHCHAGLGRTGVLIACYLIYSLRVQANTAIRYVRIRRPGSVQTRGQIICVRHFAQYILPNLVTFFFKDINRDKFMVQFTLTRFLKRQKIALHGYEERNYKYIPKIIHKICERILKLCGCWMNDFSSSNIPITTDFMCSKIGVSMQRHESIYSICSNIDDLNLLSPTSIHSPSSSSSDIMSIGSAPPSPNPSENSDVLDTFSEIDDDGQEEFLIENKCFQELEIQKKYDESLNEDAIELHDIRKVVETLIMMDFTTLPPDIRKSVRTLQNEINSSQIGWVKLNVLNDIVILSALLYDWMESLKKPVLDREHLEIIVIHYQQPEVCFSKLEMDSAYFIEYLLIFLGKLHTSSELHYQLLKRFLAALTQQYVVLRETAIPAGREFRKLRDGTTSCCMEFLAKLLTVVDLHHREKTSTPLDFGEGFKSDEESDVEAGFHEEVADL